MNIAQIFGLRVRHFRKLRSLSQEELASLCDLHRTYVGSVERGERNITLLNAEKIALSLDEPLVSFFIRESDRNGK